VQSFGKSGKVKTIFENTTNEITEKLKDELVEFSFKKYIAPY